MNAKGLMDFLAGSKRVTWLLTTLICLPTCSPGDLSYGEARPRCCMKYIPQVSLPGHTVPHPPPSQEVVLRRRSLVSTPHPHSSTDFTELRSLSITVQALACEAGDLWALREALAAGACSPGPGQEFRDGPRSSYGSECKSELN